MSELLSGLKGIQSIELGGRVLAALVDAGKPMPLGQLAKAAQMSPSKARRYLISFVRTGFVEQDSTTSLYDLSWFSLHLGLAALERRDVLRMGRPVLQRLRATLNQTIALVTWSEAGPIVIHFEESDRVLLRLVAPLGATLPLTSTAAGRIFGAWLPREKTHELIERELRRNAPSPYAPKDLSASEVEAILSEVRGRGVARMIGSPAAGISTIAAPVFGYGGDLTAAVVALGYRGSFDSSWNGKIIAALRQGAAELSRSLGYSKTMTGGSPDGTC